MDNHQENCSGFENKIEIQKVKFEIDNKLSEDKQVFENGQTSGKAENNFECKTCNKCYSKKVKLIEHQRSHTGERPFACETCGKSFSRSCNLSTHRKIHIDDKKFKCEVQ